jgi:hypothetical protein
MILTIPGLKHPPLPMCQKIGGFCLFVESLFFNNFLCCFFANSHDVLCHYILHGSFLTNFKIRGGQNGVKCFPPCRCHGVMEVILIHVFEYINWSNRFLVVWIQFTKPHITNPQLSLSLSLSLLLQSNL